MVNWFNVIPLLPLVAAVPYKKFDNTSVISTESIVPTATPTSAFASISGDSTGPLYDSTSTKTVDEYTTVYLPSTTLVIPTTATSQLSIVSAYISQEGLSTTTKRVTSYKTITSGDMVTSVPVTIDEVSAVKPGATTTGDAQDCTPVTVTKTDTETQTVTETETIHLSESSDDPTTYSTLFLTSTLTTSYPITAEFTTDSFTTTLTSFVQVTSTQTFTTETEIAHSSNTPYSNNTITENPVTPTSSFRFTGYNSTTY